LNGSLNPTSEDRVNAGQLIEEQVNPLLGRSNPLQQEASVSESHDNPLDDPMNPLADQTNPLDDQTNPLEEDHLNGSFDDQGEESSPFDEATDDPATDETGFVGLQITNVESAVAPLSVRSPSPTPNFEDIVSVSARAPEKENGHQHQLPVSTELGHFDENQVPSLT
jgi:hypothetical protein